MSYFLLFISFGFLCCTRLPRIIVDGMMGDGDGDEDDHMIPLKCFENCNGHGKCVEGDDG